MASSQKTVDFLTDQIHSAGIIRSKKMFGEYAIYCDEKVVALICDDTLFVKMTDVSLQFLNASHISPPYPGAKNYLKVRNRLAHGSYFAYCRFITFTKS